MRKIVVGSLICSAALWTSVMPAGALSGPLVVTHYAQLCENWHTAPVNVVATYRLHEQGVDRWGTVTLKASNGNSVRYQVFFQQFLNRMVGTEVVNGDPLFEGQWFDVVGEVDQSAGGYMIGATGEQQDICYVLGADNA